MSSDGWTALGVAILATHSWRILAAMVGSRIAASRRATAAIDGMACALITGIVASMVLNAGGVLSTVSTSIRLASLALAIAAYFICRRSIPTGVFIGFASLAGGAAFV